MLEVLQQLSEQTYQVRCELFGIFPGDMADLGSHDVINPNGITIILDGLISEWRPGGIFEATYLVLRFAGADNCLSRGSLAIVVSTANYLALFRIVSHRFLCGQIGLLVPIEPYSSMPRPSSSSSAWVRSITCGSSLFSPWVEEYGVKVDPLERKVCELCELLDGTRLELDEGAEYLEPTRTYFFG